MPELPEVETVRRGLIPVLEGRRIARAIALRPDLRRPMPAGLGQRLVGRVIERLERRAKYLLIRLDDGGVLIIHLGMSGRLLVGRTDGPKPVGHDHFVLETEEGGRVILNDPRRFGLIDLAEAATLHENPLFRDLGPEPLADDFTGPVLEAELSGRVSPLKSALLDQRVVAGLGNIYVCEALFRARLSPTRESGTVKGAVAKRLVESIKAVLGEAVAAGGSSLRDYVQVSGELGTFQHQFKVYGREGEPCPGCDCGKSISRIVQSGRSTFFCATKQK